MKHKPLLAALLCAASHLSHAENGTLDEVVVTATRTAQSADATLASVTVITRQDIERMQAQSVPDVLRGVPGLTLANNGGAGKATSVFLRGSNADHVLVLIDGIKIGSATTGTASFQDIPVAQIERIEIVRGPRSSLYGSEAIGGVIQIFTRKGGGALKPFFTIGGGRYQTYNGSAGVSGGGERGWFSASASGIDTNGFNACNGKPFPGGAGCFTTEPDKDGYRNASASLRAGYRLDGGIEIDVNALHATGDNKFDGSFVNQSESVQQVLGGTLRYSPADNWRITLSGGRSRDESDNFLNGAFKSRFDTERDTFSLQNDVSLTPGHLLTIGADYRDDRVGSTTAYAVTSRHDTGLFTQYQGTFGAHDVQLSLRRDDNQQFGKRDTGSAAWGYALSERLRLTASYGTAFKAPTFNQLYFPGFGSATLRPERSRSAEIGLSAQFDAARWSVNAYRTKVSDLIGFDAVFNPVNINTARLTGVEGQFHTRLDQFEFDATLTLQNPRQTSGTNQGKLLNRRPRQAIKLDVARTLGDWRVASGLYAEGKRYDDLANSSNKRLGGYGLMDVRVEYRLAEAWQLKARVENLFDKQYETAQYFNQPGRGVYFTLAYQQ